MDNRPCDTEPPETVEVVPPCYPDGAPLDEQRRAYAISLMVCPDTEFSVASLLSEADTIVAWLRDGTAKIPAKLEPIRGGKA